LLRFAILDWTNAGCYRLRATNLFGPATSAPAWLTVGPALRWQATNVVVLGSAGRTVIVETATRIGVDGSDWSPWRTNVVTGNQQFIDTSGWQNPTQQNGFLRLKIIP
jgi:hypothetical protein